MYVVSITLLVGFRKAPARCSALPKRIPKRKKKKKSKNAFVEFAESTSADFDSLQKILAEDIENIQLNDSDILDPKEVSFD